MTSLILATLFGAAQGPDTHEFALIFRPTREVAAADLPRRNDAAREWALALRRGGVLRFPAPLEEDALVVTQDGVSKTPPAPSVAAILIIQARDAEAALALVKTHPSLKYGTAIEVRPVKPTPPR